MVLKMYDEGYKIKNTNDIKNGEHLKELARIKEEVLKIKNKTGSLRILKGFILNKSNNQNLLSKGKNYFFEKFEYGLKSFYLYLEGSINPQLDENTIESLKLKLKIINKYNDKILALKIIDDFEEIKDKFIKYTEKFLINKLVLSFFRGISTKEQNVYIEILKSFNKFLEYIGIYTTEINLKEEPDFNCYDILTVEETDDKNLIGKVADIISYPYWIGNELVSEGIIIVYSRRK